MKSINEEAILWLIKEQEGLSTCEKKELEQWLNESKEHKEAYISNKLIRETFKSLPNNKKEELKEKANTGIKRAKFIQKIRYFSTAAIFLLAVGIGSYKYYIDFTNPSFSKALISNNKIENKYLLPDNSKIVLDVNSTMNIDYYKNRREVTFPKGKAVFYVAKDKSRPFIINASNAQIEVLGTSFEVSNLNDKVSIKVKEGTVKISKKEYDKIKTIITLTKKEQLTLNRNGKVSDYGKIELERIATWEKGFLSFYKTPLKTVIKEFSRYIDIDVKYENEDIAYTAITGKFAINEFNKFLEALPKIYPLKLDRDKNYLRFSEKF